MLEKIKEFIPDLIIYDIFKEPSMFFRGTMEHMIILIEDYKYLISSSPRYMNKKSFFNFLFGHYEGEEPIVLYEGTNFNELINAIKEEMKRRKENE